MVFSFKDIKYSYERTYSIKGAAQVVKIIFFGAD